MKNYTYEWALRDKGYVELPEHDYTESMLEMKEFVGKLSDVVKAAACGWSGVEYKVMENKFGVDSFMVLKAGKHSGRWIPVTGNSKGCNLSVLGENLW